MDWFKFLSWRNALEDPPGLPRPIYPQAQFDPVDFDIRTAGFGLGQGVVFGCKVTPSSPEALTFNVSQGQVVIDGVVVDVDAITDVSIPTPNATQPRFDLVLVDDTGVPFASSGTPTTHSPPYPPLPDDAVCLASIYVQADLDEVLTAHIVDKRIPVSLPADATADWQRLEAGADVIRDNNASLVADPDLAFTMADDTAYAIRGHVVFNASGGTIVGPGSTRGVRWGWLGPASPDFMAITERRINNALATSFVVRAATAYDTGGVVISGTSSLFIATVSFDGIIHNGANVSPDFAFAWGQSIADAADTTRMKGSILEYRPIGA